MCVHAQYIQFINEIVHFIILQINSKKKLKKIVGTFQFTFLIC